MGIKRLFPILFTLCFFSFKANASNYYWIGGTGNWDDLSHWATASGGPILYTQIPTALDDVYFDANSFSAPGQIVHLDPLTIFVHSMNWTGVTNNPTMAAPATNLLKIYGSLVFASAMTMDFLGNIHFEATTAGQIITTGSRILPEITFNGIGGAWTLQDDLTTSGGIFLNAGTLNSNDKNVTATKFQSQPVTLTTRELIMGASVFTITSNAGWAIGASTTVSVDAGTSVINMPSGSFGGGEFTYYDLNFTDPSVSVNGSIGALNHFHNVVFASNGNIGNGNYFNDVVISRDGEIIGNNVFHDLSFAAGYSYQFGSDLPSNITTINGAFHATGTCAALIDIHSGVTGTQATISHPAGNVNVSYLVLKDINATGGATFTASNSSDLGNNTGWNFTSAGAQELYWIGNGGNWSDGNHWSHTSGGAVSGCSPTPEDNVFFDANSFSLAGQIVSVDPLIAYCRNMVWTTVTNNPSFGEAGSNLLKIYGSLTFSANMDMSFGGEVNFEATTTGQTITMAGQYFNNLIRMNGIGGGWTLQDELNVLGTLFLNAGTFTSNDKTINAYRFESSSSTARTLNMGASVFNIVGEWDVENGPITINCGTSVVNIPTGLFRGGDHTYYDLNFTNTSPYDQGLVAGINTFHDVVFGARGTLLQHNNFHNVTFYGDGIIRGIDVENDLTFTDGHNYSLNGATNFGGTFHATGNCTSFIDIHSASPGTQASIGHSSGTVNTSYLILKDISAGGGATFNAGSSTDLGNNSGWNISTTAGQDFYWIGNAGNWSDGNHWSHTSGGAPLGCSPTPIDNVFFDANSFSTTGQSVLMDPLTTYCRNMTWTNVTNNPTLSNGPVFSQLRIYGSLVFSPNMSTPYTGLVYFESTNPGQTITMAGQSFHSNVDFNGIGGGWTLQDTFNNTGLLLLDNGTLNTNDQTVNILAFQSVSNTDRAINLGASVVNISTTSTGNASWDVNNDYFLGTNFFTVNCGTSVINLPEGSFGAGTNHVYYDVNFTNTTGTFGSVSGNGDTGTNHFHNVIFATPFGRIGTKSTFNSLTFMGDGSINSDHTYNDLNFTAGFAYTIQMNTTQTIIDHWRIQGNCTSYILLETSEQGSEARFTKMTGEVPGYNIHIKDIRCTGGAHFIAYNSVDLGGNAGWDFSILPPLNDPGIIVGPSQVCVGSSSTVVYHIAPIAGAISYQWTVPPGATIVSGQGDTTIIVNFGTATSGNIIVQSFNGCDFGAISSALVVTVGTQSVPAVTIAADTTGPVCTGVPITFTATASYSGSSTLNYDFLVNGISAQSGNSNIFITATLLNNDEVSCLVTVAATGCFAPATAMSDTILISANTDTAFHPHVSIIASPDGEICAGLPIIFTATISGTGNNNVDYNFKVNGSSVQQGSSNTFTTNTLRNNDAVTCTISVSSGTCFTLTNVTSNIIFIDGHSCNVCELKIPNAITPNGDGINDRWVLSNQDCFRQVSVNVYNRYGSPVYQKNNYQNEWEGTYKSKTLPDGTYYYVIRATRRDGQEQVLKGNVTILR